MQFRPVCRAGAQGGMTLNCVFHTAVLQRSEQGKAAIRGGNLSDWRKEAYGSTTVARETRLHAALTLDKEKIRGFLDGQLQFEISDALGWVNTGAPLRIGHHIVPPYATYRTGFQGCIAGARLTVGSPRYTSNFAVPYLPLPEQ